MRLAPAAHQKVSASLKRGNTREVAYSLWSQLERDLAAERARTAKGIPLGVAASILLLLLFAGGSAGTAKFYHDKLVLAENELHAREIATPATPTNLDDWFRQEFKRARQYRASTVFKPAQNNRETDRILLYVELEPSAQPPFFSGIKVDWGKGGGPEMVYWAAGRTPFVPVLTQEYDAPKSGVTGKRITIYFQTTFESMTRLGVKDEVAETFQLILSPRGGRIVDERDDGGLVFASIGQPKNGVLVSDPFPVDLTLQAPAGMQRGGSGRIVHLLIRPLDGYAPWQEQYVALPFRQSVYELPSREQTFRSWVSLRGILDLEVALGEKTASDAL